MLEKEIDITKEITISGNEYRNMLRRCADYNVTIFSYIISKVAKVFSDMYGKKILSLEHHLICVVQTIKNVSAIS